MFQNIKNRFKCWQQLGKVESIYESLEMVAGRQGEYFLQSLIGRKYKASGTQCFVGKRIPSPKHQCRFEVDLIVLTHNKLYILEVKNWSGKLHYEESGWIQVKRDGSEVKHLHLTQHNNIKAVALISYLKDQGIELDRSKVSHKVLFMNHNLIVDKTIGKDAHVIQRWQLNQYLDSNIRRNASERLLHGVVNACIGTESKKTKDIVNQTFTKSERQALVETLDRIRTWDMVKLHGGRILQGDALQLITRAQSVAMDVFPQDTKLKFNWPRNRLWAFIKIIWAGRAPGVLKNKIIGKTDLYPDYGMLNFQAAGSPKLEQIPLKQIDWVNIG